MAPAVIVVGAGPAGAALAYLLARRGIATTLFERHTDFAREFRGEGLMPSGSDALAQMGLTSALDGLPQARVRALEVYRGARRLVRADAPAADTLPRVVSQPALLEMLATEAARYPAFRLERGTTVRDLVWQDGRIVGVQADGIDGRRELRADLVVGTDGRASVVRARAGLVERRQPQAFDVVWCKVPLPDFLRGTAHAYLGRGHAALAFPSYDERLQLGWLIDKGAFGELRRRGVEEWVAEMRAHVSPDLAAHLGTHGRDITHPFLLDVVCGRVETWTRPGVLLLGDAAHAMSPVGAQGINVALRDALVAANHLVPALLGGAALDDAAHAVEVERLPEVATIQALQQRPPTILFGRTVWARLAIDRILPIAVRTGVAQRLFAAFFRRFAYGTAAVRLAV